MQNILIIGGNAAGLTAASRAKRLDPRLNVTVLEKSPYISYSTCGIPYYFAKMVESSDLVSYTPESFEKERGIKVHNNTRIDEISPSRKRVMGTRLDTDERVEFSYERLLIATGVKPKLPDIPGTGLKNVFTIIDLQDAIRISEALDKAQRVAIIGAGYVGLEVAECLQTLGKTVHLFEREPQVLPGIDHDMAQIIEYELQRFGVMLSVGAKVLALVGSDGRIARGHGGHQGADRPRRAAAGPASGRRPPRHVLPDRAAPAQPALPGLPRPGRKVGPAGGILQ